MLLLLTHRNDFGTLPLNLSQMSLSDSMPPSVLIESGRREFSREHEPFDDGIIIRRKHWPSKRSSGATERRSREQGSDQMDGCRRTER